MKRCQHCEKQKPTAEFNKRQSYCRPCQSARYKVWLAKNREKRLAYHQQYRQENIESIRVRESERYSQDPHVSARRLIQSRVRKGSIPAARDLSCHDCGGPASEYDHYAGYVGKAREMVQPVCRPCHLARGMNRKDQVEEEAA